MMIGIRVHDLKVGTIQEVKEATEEKDLKKH